MSPILCVQMVVGAYITGIFVHWSNCVFYFSSISVGQILSTTSFVTFLNY
jgi:hypothetical protein